jgi:DNA-binding transcriptional MerR regulator
MKNDAPMTIGKVANALEIPPSTARQYVKDFQHTGEFSDVATPAPGQTRLFTNDDIGIMWTIKLLRAQRKSTDDIAAALIAGDRFYPETQSTPDDNQTDQDAPGETKTEETAITIYGAFSDTLKLYESRVSSYETELKEERTARLAAEIRATAAETELRVLREKKPGFWARLFNRSE